MVSVQQKTQDTPNNRKLRPIQRKIINQQTVPKKDLMADILDDDFKITVIKILRELKEDVEKVKEKVYAK